MRDKSSMSEAATRALCDVVVARAANAMVEICGASVPMVIDRLLTYAAAQAVSMDGSGKTSATFHELAERIEAGIFGHLEAEPPRLKN